MTESGMEPDEEYNFTPPPFEPWTPVKVERTLHDLFYAVARAEIELRKALDHELDCKLAYEREHAIASTHPECPRPSRSTEVTVAQRDDWIRGMEIDAYDAWMESKLQVERISRYQRRLSEQVSIVQSMSKHVLAAYDSRQGAGAR
jgi:hypothetical protein